MVPGSSGQALQRAPLAKSHRTFRVLQPALPHQARGHRVLDVVVHPLSEGIEAAEQLVRPLDILPELILRGLHGRKRPLSPDVGGLLLHQQIPLDLRER